MANKINIDYDFNPATWCQTDGDIRSQPIKRLVCAITDVIQFITPLTRFIELLFGIVRDFILDNHEYTEILIILAPVIPIGVLVGYFFDTL